MRHYLVPLALAAASCNAQPDLKQAETSLRETDSRFNQAVAAKDANALAAFYLDDAILMPTAEPAVRGRAAIGKEWAHILAIPDFQNSNKLDGVRVSKAADMAVTYGSYSADMMGEDGKMTVEPGKWLTVWNRAPDGSWKIALDTYNTDIPPPDHK